MYKPAKPVKNIIVGAGPAGIQLAYFFEKAGIDYVILERNALAGSFFDRYPLSGQLISINKPNTGSDNPDFNLRHDWNSLLSDDGPKFTDYSKDYYPDRKDLVRYLNDFAEKYKIKIKYSHAVDKIRKVNGGGYALGISEPNGKWVYRCEKLIIATGLGNPSTGSVVNNTSTVKHYGEYTADYFKKPENLAKFDNKHLLLVGNGNSAYELGNLLTPRCSTITIIGRSFKQWAMCSHYAGDLRSVYIPYYDTFLLKSLNAFNKIRWSTIIINEENSKYNVEFDCGKCKVKHRPAGIPLGGFDHVILCTGWKFDESIFEFDLSMDINDKYPAITNNYESVNNEGLFFIGALMHSHDYKKSSGGFIHGFRYLIKYFFQVNYDSGKFDTQVFDASDLNAVVRHIIYKINYTSAMYQMFSQIVDVLIYDEADEKITYLNDVHYRLVGMQPRNEGLTYIVISLEYSNREPETNITELGVQLGTIGSESRAVLIHPVIRVIKDKGIINKALIDEIHFYEEIFARFDDRERFVEKFYRTLKMFIN
jgi:thioredoxin reductase